MIRLLAALPERPQPAAVRYIATAAIMAACGLLQWAVREYSGFSGLFILFFGIFSSGLLFNRGSGYFATVVGTAIGWFVLSPDPADPRAALPVGLFAASGILCAFLSESLRKTLEQLAAAERAKELLLQEVLHRTKNNILNISSLLVLQSRSASSPEVRDAFESAANRVRVMVDVHDFLRYSGGESLVRMDDYLVELGHKLADSLRGSRPIAVNVAAEALELREQKAVSVGIIVNELVTNSFKYAFPGERTGRIDVALRMNDEATGYVLQVSDNGVGCEDNVRDGLGSRLMLLMTEQIGGKLERDRNKDGGCRATLHIPRRR